MQAWPPTPGAGEISVNPLFVNETLGDFRLTPSSPCKGTGYPVGLDIGALGSPTDVSPTTWGKIKVMFSR